nr:unnamed protein product [Digitaria exilis]
MMKPLESSAAMLLSASERHPRLRLPFSPPQHPRRGTCRWRRRRQRGRRDGDGKRFSDHERFGRGVAALEIWGRPPRRRWRV